MSTPRRLIGSAGASLCCTYGTGRGGSNWSFTNEAGGARHVAAVRVALQASHAEVLADAAMHGADIVMLPVVMAEQALAQGRLRRPLTEWRVDPMSVHIVYGSRNDQPVAMRKLIEHLVDVLGDETSGRRDPVVKLAEDSVDYLGPRVSTPAALLRASGVAKAGVRLAA